MIMELVKNARRVVGTRMVSSNLPTVYISATPIETSLATPLVKNRRRV